MMHRYGWYVVSMAAVALLAASWLSVRAAAPDAAPAAAAAATEPAPPANLPPGYVLVFHDEFNEKHLDTGKWWTRYIYNGGMLDTLNDEQERYRENDNHVMTGSTLDLTARIKPDPTNKRFRYESGMIRSMMTFKYGYFEARVKVPAARGTWPAFWLNSDADAQGKLSWPPEIDILEMGLNIKDDKPNMTHFGLAGNSKQADGANPWETKELFADPQYKKNYYHAPFDFPDGFHVFGLLWTPDDHCTLFVDNTRVCEYHYKWVYKDGQDAPYAHILCNLAVGGQWAGRYGVDDAAFPQALQVDYIRVYQLKDHIMTGRDTIGRDLMPEAESGKK